MAQPRGRTSSGKTVPRWQTWASQSPCAPTSPSSTAQAMARRPTEPLRELHQAADSAVDVYAFGILMWQLFHGALPYPGADNEDLQELALAGGISRRSSEQIEPAYEAIMRCCVTRDPARRPTAQQLQQAVQHLLVERHARGASVELATIFMRRFR